MWSSISIELRIHTYLCICVSVCLSIYLSTHLSAFIYLSIYLSNRFVVHDRPEPGTPSGQAVRQENRTHQIKAAQKELKIKLKPNKIEPYRSDQTKSNSGTQIKRNHTWASLTTLLTSASPACTADSATKKPPAIPAIMRPRHVLPHLIGGDSLTFCHT